MVMVLGVSLVGTVAVLTWGLPAIDDMKANVEVQGMRGQMQEFLADVQELVAGTAGKTAKRWQPSLQRGELQVREDTEPWIIAADKRSSSGTNGWNFTWGLGCGTTQVHGICVQPVGDSVPTPGVKVYVLSGATETEGSVSTRSDDASAAPSWSSGWTSSTEVFYLYDADDNPIDLASAAVKVEITNGGDVISQAWYFRAGDVLFRLSAGVNERTLVVTNGGLFQGQDGDHVLMNSPPVPPPREHGGASRLFVRFVELSGATSFAGQHRGDVLLSLESTAVREDLDCPSTAASDDADCISRVRFYALGDRGSDWIQFFTSSTSGYGMTKHANAMSASTDEFALHHRGDSGRATFTLVHSHIEVSG